MAISCLQMLLSHGKMTMFDFSDSYLCACMRDCFFVSVCDQIRQGGVTKWVSFVKFAVRVQ